jgi:t-SNARE complex subunit (syntaxin)
METEETPGGVKIEVTHPEQPKEEVPPVSIPLPTVTEIHHEVTPEHISEIARQEIASSLDELSAAKQARVLTEDLHKLATELHSSMTEVKDNLSEVVNLFHSLATSTQEQAETVETATEHIVEARPNKTKWWL